MAEPAADLSEEISNFLRDRAALRAKHGPKWVVYSGDQFQNVFEDYEHAAHFAIERFRSTVFLVRNLDADDEQAPLIFWHEE